MMNLLSLWRGGEIKHWKITGNQRSLVNFNIERRAAHKISMAWITGILRYRLPLASNRTLPISMRYQQLTQELIEDQNQEIVQYETKQSSKETRKVIHVQF